MIAGGMRSSNNFEGAKSQFSNSVTAIASDCFK
jgi:hypothetical protein